MRERGGERERERERDRESRFGCFLPFALLSAIALSVASLLAEIAFAFCSVATLFVVILVYF